MNSILVKATSAWAAALTLCGLMIYASPAASATLVVIVNANNPVSQLSIAEVKSYFMKTRSVWSNGEKVRPVDQKEGADRDEFLRKVLQMSSEDVVRYWLEKQYASADSPPPQVSGDEAAIKFVSTFKGGIGFISRESLGTSKNVKSILEVNY